ncbi:hypothetical protein PENTCL1PPCAC_25262 [Pristionchus entomophagus]|uniref:Surfeit locus protein 2 n=1 Tax=Pristionchus entomophagus TaxID=358040 RepID=A0AAV5U9F4_9BILA|nr:hypothetical protein PENTCL1PPCAC_25262 [Pristionchus entomophagus]
MADAKAVDALLAKFPVFESVEGFNKLRCTLTAHELPKRAADLQTYCETKKFVTAFEVYTIRQEHPDVFEDLDEKGVLGCKVTRTVLAADPADMRRHLEGKRFKKKLEWRKKREAQGIAASSDEEEDEEMEMDKDKGEEGIEETQSEDEEDFEEDDDDDEEGEYPGLGKKAEASVGGAESYDFSVMDTELEEQKGGQKKRKRAKNGSEPAKKKAKKAK